MSPRLRCLALLLCLLPAVLLADPLSLHDGMDERIKPGDDFFAYTNGGWLRHTAIPDNRSNISRFSELADITRLQVIDLINDLSRAHDLKADARKVADYYGAYMDADRVEARRLDVLKPQLAAIAKISSRTELSHYLGSTLRADVDVMNNTSLITPRLFGLWVAQDMDAPDRYAAFLLQGGLGMPDREYYVGTSEHMRALQGQYQAHIKTMLKLLGDGDVAAGAQAKLIYALEHAIAEQHVSRAASEDVQRGHNHRTPAQLAAEAPGMDWDAFLRGAGLEQQSEFVAWQPSALKASAALVGSTPLSTWKAYLRYHAADDNAEYLPKAFVEAHFAFYDKALEGTPQMADRWKSAIDSLDASMGEAVGKLYVDKHFPPETKRQIQALVKNLTAAFGRRIDALDWMDPATKATAKAKLAALKVGVGYPDRWRDYGALEIRADDLWGNHERAAQFEYRRNVAKLGRPVDRDEWCLNAQEVNAVNLPVMNALNFPAAILQAPYFDPTWPDTVNYGAIGIIIGHEISHSFDNMGAQYDATGRLHDWWTPADYAHFKAAGARLAAQFDAYRPFPDLAVNGEQTLSENLADLAGMAASYDALHLALAGKPGDTLEGFTPDQQFFIAIGQTWRAKFREAALRQRIVTDGHAPGEYRARTVRNLDAWYAAFGVQPGQALYLSTADRVRVW